MIKIKASKDKAPNLPEIVELLEKEVGFAPIVEVGLELRGRLVRADGRLTFEATGTGQRFEVERVEPQGTALPEGQELELEGALVDVHSGERIVVRQPKDAASGKPR